jgi:hypothetical protein
MKHPNTLTQEQALELAKKYDAECHHQSDRRPYLEWASYEFSLEELTSFANAAFALGVAQEREEVIAWIRNNYQDYPILSQLLEAIRARK